MTPPHDAQPVCPSCTRTIRLSGFPIRLSSGKETATRRSGRPQIIKTYRLFYSIVPFAGSAGRSQAGAAADPIGHDSSARLCAYLGIRNGLQTQSRTQAMPCIFLTFVIFSLICIINMQYQPSGCCFFSSSQKGVAFRGRTSHPCRFTWVPLGGLDSGFPDSGRSVARIGASRAGSGPCISREICPLPFTTHKLWRSTVTRLCLGCAALTAATAARAQTYYYYPSTATSAPVYNAGTTAAPVYYVPSTYRNRVAWNGYTPQYYQVNYTTPNYQAYLYAAVLPDGVYSADCPADVCRAGDPGDGAGNPVRSDVVCDAGDVTIRRGGDGGEHRDDRTGGDRTGR